MPPILPRKSRRVTLNLYDADCAQLEHRYGRGWTSQVRLLVEQNCKAWRLEREGMPTPAQIIQQLIEDSNAK